jgi:hypothetical protein
MTSGSNPWIPATPLDEADYLQLRRRAIFECHKWDPQVGDVGVIARLPLVLRHEAWREVVRLAESLAAETLDAEAELLTRPDLHRRLGLSRGVRKALGLAAAHPSAGAARIMRFDFHYTTAGWRISETNSDVPGGLNEASGFAELIAPHYQWATMTGDPAGAYCRALLAAARSQAPTIALVHATAYSDDQQMMAYLAARLTKMGAITHLASPAHIVWRNGRAHLDAQWWRGPLDVLVRFFPSEWLKLLPDRNQWQHFFAGSATVLSNPSTAILSQSKRFPLTWDDLDTPLPTWRALLPETRDPRHIDRSGDSAWVLKPALGRVGEGVGIREAIDDKQWARIRRSARWFPSQWVAQRRFETVALETGLSPSFPCLGVYSVDRRVVGAYGRLASQPLIDSQATDAAVLTAA